MVAYILLLLLSGHFALAEEAKKEIPTFNSKEDCDNAAYCYCSEDGDYRKRRSDDTPIYVPNDPHGKFCYCKQWDRDHAPKASTFAIYKRKAVRWVKNLFNIQ